MVFGETLASVVMLTLAADLRLFVGLITAMVGEVVLTATTGVEVLTLTTGVVLTATRGVEVLTLTTLVVLTATRGVVVTLILGVVVEVLVIVTVLFEIVLFLLGFGAVIFFKNFPLPPLAQLDGLANDLRRYLRLKIPHSL